MEEEIYFWRGCFNFEDEIKACKALYGLEDTVLQGTADKELEKIVEDMGYSFREFIKDYMHYLEIILKRHQDMAQKLYDEYERLKKCNDANKVIIP